jgi:hypothetical protein
VIGVHSAKFPAEAITANLRAAVMRHGIDHPVVNDADFAIWNSFAVRALPTVVLIDPVGKVAAQQAGEIDAAEWLPLLDAMLAEFAARGQLDRSPVLGVQPERPAPSALLFPTKLTTAPGDRLLVADTGHHRILEVQLRPDGLAGEIVRSFGTGEAGRQDGLSHIAQFHTPQGLALCDNTLYVADTENHLIRAIDLVRDEVRTVAGTGVKGRGLVGLVPAGSAPTEVALRSPWGLAVVERELLIAMAGSHQIWRLIDETQLAPFAGSGAEALIDGPRAQAAFNQPSDLALMGDALFVADAEAGAIRALTLDGDAGVLTLVGQGLFDFGDVDGVGATVRLQHPTGLAAHEGLLYLADSYNHKLKTLNPADRRVQTLCGSGTPGLVDGSAAVAQFYEPSGLVVAGPWLYVADTNNHCLRVVERATGWVETLALG